MLYVGLDESGLLYWQVEKFADSALYPLFVMIGITALARALLQPKRPHWRVFELDDASARAISFAVQAIAVVYALDYLARRLVSILSLPLSASIVTAFIASLLYAAMLLLIVRTPMTSPNVAPGVPVSRWRPRWLKFLLLRSPSSSSRPRCSATSRSAASSLRKSSPPAPAPRRRAVAHRHPGHRAGADRAQRRHERAHRAALPTGRLRPHAACSRAAGRAQHPAVCVAVPLLLLAWGMTTAEIQSWMRAAVFGFDVGGVRISLARILVALALFVGLLAATRFVQRWLAAGALAQGRMDPASPIRSIPAPATSALPSPRSPPSPTPASTSRASPSSPARCRSASASACSPSSTTSCRG